MAGSLPNRAGAVRTVERALWVDEADLAAFDRLLGTEAAIQAKGGDATGRAVLRNRIRWDGFRRLLAQAAAQQAFEERPHLPAVPGLLPPRPPLYAGIVCGDCRGPMAAVGTDLAPFGICYQSCKGSLARRADQITNQKATAVGGQPAAQGQPAVAAAGQAPAVGAKASGPAAQPGKGSNTPSATISDDSGISPLAPTTPKEESTE